ncbi:hypothetical protein BD324DRAFT_649696 [Kockovaella imperatae]|uniref:Uncharacterized protein n=1 Tax=Kockovaella imperatae TaxID=4999 RepID=A0A1Y1UJU1_9TREE|nr:hypothetical protein BD324DRAFT_649696 [Kockovaella imperatae]ORX38321.1 hypothetical protein BD324DRAFT_649696 [Kockovaella imperatae]
MPRRARSPESSESEGAQFVFGSKRQILALPRRAQDVKQRPVAQSTSRASSKEPPAKVRRLEYRQPREPFRSDDASRSGEKSSFKGYREPSRIPSDKSDLSSHSLSYGTSDDAASTDRALTIIECELGSERESSPICSDECEGDEIDLDLDLWESSPSPMPIKSGHPSLTWTRDARSISEKISLHLAAPRSASVASSTKKTRGEKRRRALESFRGQKRRRGDVTSDEETDTSDGEASSTRQYKVKSPRVTMMYAAPTTTTTSSNNIAQVALGPTASIVDLARRIGQLDATSSDIIMHTDSEGEEDEAIVSAALSPILPDSPISDQIPFEGVSVRSMEPVQLSAPGLCVPKQHQQQQQRDARSESRRQREEARKSNTKAPIWTQMSAADPRRVFWAKYMSSTRRARPRPRNDEYDTKLPGQRTARHLRQTVHGPSRSDSMRVPRPGTMKGSSSNTICIGQIHILLLTQMIAHQRWRRDVKLEITAKALHNLPPMRAFFVDPWWRRQVVSEEEEEVAVENGLLPPVDVGHVDLKAAEVFFHRPSAMREHSVSVESEEQVEGEAAVDDEPTEHDILDEVSDVDRDGDEDDVSEFGFESDVSDGDDPKDVSAADARLTADRKRRARSESTEPRESALERSRRINESIVQDMSRRAAFHAAREARYAASRDAGAPTAPFGATATTVTVTAISPVVISPMPRRIAPIVFARSGHPDRELVAQDTAVRSSVTSELRRNSVVSIFSEDVESVLDASEDLERESRSVSPVESTTTTSTISEPPNYDDLEPTPPLSLPLSRATIVNLARANPHQILPPPYQAALPLRGAAYSSQRTPSPPPPFNAQTDAVTLIPPHFDPFNGDSHDDPFQRDTDALEAMEERRLVGSFPGTGVDSRRTLGRASSNISISAVNPIRGNAIVQAVEGRTSSNRRPRSQVVLAQLAVLAYSGSIDRPDYSFDAAGDMEQGDEDDLSAELEEVDRDDDQDESSGELQTGSTLVGGLRRWVGRFWG